MNQTAMEIRLILGDQLNAYHSWFQRVDDQVLYVMAELPQEATYVRHHVQKVLAFCAAMRQFAEALTQAGHRVHYVTLDDAAAHADLPALLQALCADTGAQRLSYQYPDEYRLDQQLAQLQETLEIPVSAIDSEHFLTPRDAWQSYPNHRMEFFYRALRKEYGVLLDPQGQPEGGRWNYDQDNRQKLPKDAVWPEPLCFAHDVRDLQAMLARHGIDTLGTVDAQRLVWPLTRRESRALLDFFLHHCLPDFGRYQDALTPRDWSLFHSRLSFSLNTKMLHPLEVIRAAEAHWRAHQETITLSQVEGFIRQILGWREFVRALYWAHMPDYGSRNFFGHQRPLPDYFWTGKTDMACMAHSIGQSLEFAYAHHIQRLMVIGNFALLAGLDPDAVDDWYLGIYIDAIEWVELPNTRGMSQYADGGLIASKPYVSSGQYIQKMGDYCRDCRYQVKQKTGPESCPFNSLYWHFLHRHRNVLSDNARLKLVYANWDRQPAKQREYILDTAQHHLARINQL